MQRFLLEPYKRKNDNILCIFGIGFGAPSAVVAEKEPLVLALFYNY